MLGKFSPMEKLLFTLFMLLTLGIGWLFVQVYPQYAVSSSNAAKARALNKQITTLNQKTASLSYQYIDELVTQANVNFTTKIKQNKAALTKAFTETYNTNSDMKYKKLQRDVPKLVSSELADRLIAAAKKPSASESQFGAVYPFKATKNVTVGFGSYSIRNHSVEVHVLVVYTVPKVTVANGDKRTTKTANYSFTLNLKTDAITNITVDYGTLK